MFICKFVCYFPSMFFCVMKLNKMGWFQYMEEHIVYLPWSEEQFEDTKGVTRNRKSKERQHKGQRRRDQESNNDLQSTTQTTKDWATRIPLTSGGELEWNKSMLCGQTWLAHLQKRFQDYSKSGRGYLLKK